MKTNRDKLAKIAINTRVDHPRMKGYYTGFDGAGRILPGTGGITYNFFIGDNCMDIAGDHIEPGVTMAHPSSSENKAVMSLACVGNPVEVLSGPAKGAVGVVTGKHGGVNHVMAYFPKEEIEKMIGKEEFLIRSIGQGLEDDSSIFYMNLDPDLYEKLVKEKDGKKVFPVAFSIPSKLIGAGLGISSLQDGDIDFMTQDPKIIQELGLQNLKFGDLIAIEDLYTKYGPHYKEGAKSIGVITHSDSFSSGHGPGITILATDQDGDLDFEIDPEANLINYI